ncbi:lysophosphatidic acid phosphatase type 6 [Elysia marginata]|uniref:Lysophosphatidic acid phosphatase type 6 n=1 Tax=Elysia marginata TaxID=1093978 RepID=A0AAV4F067_9GAST|nr:lysophosphatidic acid phosphatase type 6 [Elysia marginata]
MFGRVTLSKHGTLKLPVKDIWDEDIFPNKLSCPSLRLAINLTLANLDNIPDYTSDKRNVLRALGLPMGHLDFSCVKDDAASRVAHGKPYPKVLEPFKEVIEMQATRVLRAVTTGRIDGLAPRDDVLMMSIGRLLYAILAEMEDVVCGVVKPRMYLYSGHDTTVVPILEVLGAPPIMWPPFGASIALELYRSRDIKPGNEFFVRAVYCWKELNLPCHKDPLIPFPVFRRMMSRYSVSPTEFRRMCGTTPAGLNL